MKSELSRHIRSSKPKYIYKIALNWNTSKIGNISYLNSMSLKTILSRIILENDTKVGKNFDYIIQFLIFVSLITFSVETLPDLSEESISFLHKIEAFTVIIFTIEYVLRVILLKKKLKFIFSFMGMVDFLAILPFYLSSGLDLRSIRVLRMFRLLRLFKLLRYNRSIGRFSKAFNEVKYELFFFAIACLFLIYVASVGIYYFEKETNGENFASIFHSMWWAVATLTTVGYGDIYPITSGGKIFSSIVIFIGLGLVAVPTGLITSAFSKAMRQEVEDTLGSDKLFHEDDAETTKEERIE